MKKIIFLGTLLTFLFLGNASQAQVNKPTKGLELKTLADSASYAYGYLIAKQLQNNMKGIDKEILKASLDAFIEGRSIFSEGDAQNAMRTFQQQKQAQEQAIQKEIGAKNKIAEQKFLAENSKKEGVKTTASGLQYQVLREGTGVQPFATSKVKVHYEGKLLDGKIFDSSIQRGDPISFELNRVIKGWTEGLQLMKVGGKYRFYIPSELAYGEAGRPGIPPSSLLIFDVDLLSIE